MLRWNGATDHVEAGTASELPVRAIVGPGRSGTTWAGTIADSCPEVIYRFEPFHRMATVHREFHDWFERLKRQDVRDSDVPRLYELLRIADPLVNKAPFFQVKSYPLRSLGRRQAWPMARLFGPANWLYRKAYTPAAGPPVVFKEVTFIKPLRNILERTRIPVVYLVRHPCATVLSEVRGQGRERMPERQRRLRKLLLENAPELIEQFPDVVGSSDAVSRTALLWRSEVEACVALVRRSERGMLLTYEQLAGNAYEASQAMLAHLRLPFSDLTRIYLDGLHGVRSAGRGRPKKTGWGKAYFSVLRNPRDEKDAWRTRITADDRRTIERVVQGSPAVEHLAALGGWW